MKGICRKCNANLDTDKGDIITINPVFHNGEFEEFILCRPHYLESEKLGGATAFLEWVSQIVEANW